MDRKSTASRIATGVLVRCQTLRRYGLEPYVVFDGCGMPAKREKKEQHKEAIIQSRIKEVIYLSDSHKESDAMTASRRMLRLAGVKFWQHTPSANRVVVDFDEAAQ